MTATYLIRTKYQSKGLPGTWLDYWQERNSDESTLTQTASDILHEIVEDVVEVVAFDLSQGKCWDATAEVAREVIRLNADNIVSDELHTFIEETLGRRVASNLVRESAL